MSVAQKTTLYFTRSSKSGRPLSIIGVFKQLPNSGILDGSWIVIRILGGNRGRAVQTVSRHADIFQRDRCAQPGCQIIDSLRSVLDTERFGSDAHGIRCSLAIE